MRQIIISILCLISAISFAQNQIRLYHTIDYSPYIGEWVYKSEDTIFTVTLKPTIVTGRYFHAEQLCGGYTLKTKKGTSSWQGESPDSIRAVDKYDNKYQLGIFAYAYGDIGALNPDMLRFTIFDKEKKHDEGRGNGGGKIYLLSSDTILWILDEKEGAKIYDVPFENLGFSVPTNVIMTKKKTNRKNKKTIDTYRKRSVQRGKVIKQQASNVNLDEIVGIWRYESNDTIFRVKFQKEFHNNTFWWLIGTYEFHAENATAYETDDYNDINTNRICIYAQNYNLYDKSLPTKLYLRFKDRIKKHNHGTGVNQGTISIISPNKIHWDLQERGDRNGIDEFSVPTNVIMTREE